MNRRNFLVTAGALAARPGLPQSASARPADEAGKQLSAEFKTKYADWPSMNVAGFVRSIYAG